VPRAYEQNDGAIATWLSETYPAIARQARLDGATVSWGDEMRLRSDHVAGTSDAPLGQSSVIRETRRRFGCNMIAAVTNRRTVAFMGSHGKFDGGRFIDFLRRLLKHATDKVSLIVDGHPVHKSTTGRRVVAKHKTRARLLRILGYRPELNPDELLNQDVKTDTLDKSRPANRTAMRAVVHRPLQRQQKQPHVITNLFREQQVRYAA
jgi:hypothetical protein